VAGLRPGARRPPAVQDAAHRAVADEGAIGGEDQRQGGGDEDREAEGAWHRQLEEAIAIAAINGKWLR